ncbi:ras-related protein Rab-13-like [Halichondria panicea]|uniref:ras-related protein Rab-13-like n=1 Tax=Halichondria panicea TaxID=6063 RepID=UPI00312BC2E3
MSHVDRNYDHLFKVLLCGDSGVGKTCLISQFTDNQIRRSHITTIGIDFKLKTFTVQGKRIRLQIWDTAGQERFETLTAQYYRRAQGILLVYDITQDATFGNVTKWLRNIEENAVDDVKVTLVGNKLDLDQQQGQRQVTTRKGEKLAKQHKCQFFETSAWSNTNITEAFTGLTEQILNSAEQRIGSERSESKLVLTSSIKSSVQQEPHGSSWCCG